MANICKPGIILNLKRSINYQVKRLDAYEPKSFSLISLLAATEFGARHKFNFILQPILFLCSFLLFLHEYLYMIFLKNGTKYEK